MKHNQQAKSILWLDEGRTDIVGDTLTTPDPVDPIDMNDQELEQYKRERVSALSEKLNMAELLPSSYAETSPMNAALQRAQDTGQAINERLNASITEYKQGEIISEGFDEATRSKAAPDKFVPAKKGGITGVNLTSLLFDPDILDAGKYDEATGAN